MFNVFKFKRMNSDVELFVPTHVDDGHRPGPEESVGAHSAESLGVMSWMDEHKNAVHRFVSAIDDASNWITSDKMFVMFANVGVGGFDTIEDMEETQSFCYDQQIWPGHPLWQLMGAKPSELTPSAIADICLDGVGPDKTKQCFAIVELGKQHAFPGKYACVLTAVGEGDFDEEIFQVSFLFLKLLERPAKYVCSYRAEFFRDQLQVIEKLWGLWPKYDLKSLIVRQVMEYQFPTLEPLVEITSDTVPPEEIFAILQEIPDSHVMTETFLPTSLSANPLERTYTGNPTQ